MIPMILVAALVAASCNAPEDREGEPFAVTGVVVEVETKGLGEVRGFVVKDGADSYAVTIDPSAQYGFPLDHLSEHRATGAPVRVEIERRREELVALSIRDA